MTKASNLEAIYELVGVVDPFPEAFPHITLVCCWLNLEPLGHPDQGCWLVTAQEQRQCTVRFRTMFDLEQFCKRHLQRFEEISHKRVDTTGWNDTGLKLAAS